MKAALLNTDGKELKSVDLVKEVFGIEPNEQLIYESVKNYLGNQRQGTSKTKGRSEVSGGGRKPWRQKGTGNARAGSNTSPVWVRGGKAFGPSPRDYHSRLPRRVKTNATKTALSEKARNSEIKILEALTVDKPKTSEMVGILKACGIGSEKVLLVLDAFDEKVFRAGRNIKELEIIKAGNLNVFSILNCRWLVFTRQAMEKTVAFFKQGKKE